MTRILNIRVEIFRKDTDVSGTMVRPYSYNLTLQEGDEIRFSIMNVEDKPQSSKEDIEE